MNKMTDKETIKGFCNKKLCPPAQEIINRQQKQLDNYSHNVRNMAKDFIDQQKIIQEQQTEIKRLNSCVKSEDEVRAIANATIQAGIKIIKAEAIKEFVEKYEKVLLSMLTTATLEKREVIYSCLDTLEEMAGKE